LDRMVPFIADPDHLIPLRPGLKFGCEYGHWYASGGKAGEKPTGDVVKLYELWGKIETTIDEKEKDRLAQEIIKLHTKNIWLIGAVGETSSLMIVKNNFRWQFSVKF